MKSPKYFILCSYALIPILFGLIFLDLSGVFNFSDIPFVTAFLLYMLFLMIQKGSSKLSFIMALFFLVFMGLSYIPTGPGRITERIGEWFYLFFVCGLIQYAKEAWQEKSV